jgi:lipopolysaccharide/colanic/teichoic acid biosynthesis glycosyltransferase
MMDLAIAVPALAVLSPVLLLIAILVRRDSPGPAIFRQRRAGLHGREFDLLKFRSMVDGAEKIGSGLTVQENDDRITKLGRLLRRTSLDELPQLVNVVRGEMSIVGPRPTVSSQISRYTDEQRRRLDARPGITGLAQVRGRASLPWSMRIAMDVEYIHTARRCSGQRHLPGRGRAVRSARTHPRGGAGSRPSLTPMHRPAFGPSGALDRLVDRESARTPSYDLGTDAFPTQGDVGRRLDHRNRARIGGHQHARRTRRDCRPWINHRLFHRRERRTL